MVVATGGVVSLRPILAALAAGKVVATANKETLVAGGHLVMPLARRPRRRARRDRSARPFASPLAWLRPIDSEHSAIWQCLVGESMARVASLILTASGGPFLDGPADLSTVTPDQALRHPTWSMGAKITIDSATLANKGLEVVEARWLYDVGDDAIEVVIHPQSVVHSAVRFVDGSLKAQLGTPDMRTPIQYALTYPDRRPSPSAAVDLVAAGRLDFRAPDSGRFPALRIAREAGRIGQRATTALIAADDVAVGRFLDGSLGFTGIPALLEAAVERFGAGADQAPEVDALVALDAEVRAFAAAWQGSRHERPARRPRHDRPVPRRPRRPRPRPRARPLHHGPPRRHPGPRVRDRLPAAGEGPPGEGRDALHAELAADRRLRQARGRGRRRRPTIRARSSRARCRSS